MKIYQVQLKDASSPLNCKNSMVSRDYLLLTGKLEVWKSKAKIETSFARFLFAF